VLVLLLGNGDGTFRTGQSTVGFGLFFAADLNGDGKLDLVSGCFGSGNQVCISLGNGDGTFQTPVSYAVGSTLVLNNGVVGDFNGDGKVDLGFSAGVNLSGSQEVVVILSGNGDGTFQTPITVQVDASSLPIVAGDFNNDGTLDVASPLSVVFLQGQFPAVQFSSASLSFGPEPVGTTSPSQSVTLTNVGLANLTLSGISITGVNASDFAETNSCATSFAPNANCQIAITFTPTAGGTRYATLSVTDNSPGSPQVVYLTGTSPTAAVTLTPMSITFPSQYVGTSGLPQTVTLTNSGTASLTISSVTTSGSDFGTLSACGTSVSPGSSCSIGVFFDPTTTGIRSGSLTVTDNSVPSTQTVSLSGTGQDFSMAPSGSSSATISAGQTATYMVSLTPAGGFNQAVALSCVGAPSLSSCSFSSSSVTLNGSSPTSFEVTITTAGSSARLSGPFNGHRSSTGLLAIWILPIGLAGLAFCGGKWRKHNRVISALGLISLLSLGLALSACGGGSTSSSTAGGTPAGTYTISVSGSSSLNTASLTHTTQLTLIVK
jgi:hypothetical protein